MTTPNDNAKPPYLIATKEPEANVEITREVALVLSLGHFDLAFHRLKSAAQSLLATRRKLTDNQVAMLAWNADELLKAIQEPEPKWPAPTCTPEGAKQPDYHGETPHFSTVNATPWAGTPASATETPTHKYSHYRAAVKRNGKIWFLATPDGRNGLPEADAKELIDALNGSATLRAQLTEAQAELARLDPGVHTCTDDCPRLACVLRRELSQSVTECDQLRAERDELVSKAYKLEAERDELVTRIHRLEADNLMLERACYLGESPLRGELDAARQPVAQ